MRRRARVRASGAGLAGNGANAIPARFAHRTLIRRFAPPSPGGRRGSARTAFLYTTFRPLADEVIE